MTSPVQHLRRWLKPGGSDGGCGGPWRIGQVVLQSSTDDADADAQRYVLMHEADWLLQSDAHAETAAAANVAVVPQTTGATEATALRRLAGMEDFRELLRWDADGKFRPLRASPNLRSGWVLGPLDFADLVVALRFLYPGAVADWALHSAGTLRVTPYEESAARQTGRFSAVRKLGSERLSDLLQECCASNCARTPLWSGAPAPAAPPGEEAGPRIPLLCPEACNYFISKAREKILGRVD